MQGWNWIAPACWSINDLTHWPIIIQNNPHACIYTHCMWLTCWNFLFNCNVTWHEKFLIWNTAIDSFLAGYRTNPLHIDFLKMKSLDITCFIEDYKHACMFHTMQWYFSAFIMQTPKFTHLPCRCQHCFLKNMWYPGHIQIIFVTHWKVTHACMHGHADCMSRSNPLSTLVWMVIELS